MLFHILLTCSLTTVLVQCGRLSRFIQAQPRVGFSSSVVHAYPGSDNLHGESSVKVNFQPQQGLASQNFQTRNENDYSHANMPSRSVYTRTNFNDNPKGSNSFNVGYNISFSNDQSSRRKKQRYTSVNNKKIENAEVITGKSKKNEKVRAPSINIDLSPQDFVSHAFLKQKQMNSETFRHTSSPIVTKAYENVKYLSPVQEQSSRFLSQSPKFTYNTQQNIFKDVNKATKPIQFSKELKASYQTSSRWKNVSPGLEVSKSIEPQIINQRYGSAPSFSYTSNRALGGEPKHFNHDDALRNSESFDFSNAHGKILYGENNLANDNSPEGSEQYTQKVNTHQVNEFVKNINAVESNLEDKQLPHVNNVNVEDHIPTELRGIKALPLDTSLLKDVVLTTDSREVPKGSKIIPVRFDISNIQRALQDQVALLQNHHIYQQAFINQQHQNREHFDQLKNIQSPSPSQSSSQTYEDHTPSVSQNDFRMYGTPEPTDTNQYKTGYRYDQKSSNFDNDVYKIVSMRPPPVGQNIRY